MNGTFFVPDFNAAQMDFLNDFLIFANYAWPHFQYAWNIKTRRPDVDVQWLMFQDAFWAGRDLAPIVQPCLDDWNRLTVEEKTEVGAFFGKEVVV